VFLHKPLLVSKYLALKNRPNERFMHGWTACHAAAYIGGAKQEIWDLLLKFYASLDSRDDNGSSAFIIAAQEDHTETLEILANLGANIYATDNCGCTALHQATLRNQVQVIKFLVEGLKINVDYQSSNGSSALLFAAHENHPELIEMLITELGAHKDLIDIEGQSAVMRASYRGNEASLRTFVRLNADMKSANNYGYGALHLASLSRP
jgi:ankyrin repeat protein